VAGVAPRARLVVYKVLSDTGEGDDGWIIKALDHIAETNEKAAGLVVAGMNLSLGGPFDASVYGVGHSPLCQELRRLWRQGVLAVVACGNDGRVRVRTDGDAAYDLNPVVAVGDPANLEECIAVGSVHADRPHVYGVSYFSSRGPTADGRAKLEELSRRYESLAAEHGWQQETIHAYPAEDDLRIRAWRTPQRGEALWIISGIHGEEPAGPNAIAGSLASIVELAASGVPVVLVPLCNPKAYRNNWRYPNTAERDWRKGGYSVGDAEYLLPDAKNGKRPRVASPPGPETRALTEFVLRVAKAYPPRLVLDLHEDELSTDGGYIYSQGSQVAGNPVGAEIIRVLRESGIPIRQSGRTRFDEPIVDGVISRDAQGLPIRDGSIDELLAAGEILLDGKTAPGPAAHTVIVVETPAFAGSRFDLRVAAHSAVVHRVRELWRLSSAAP
jgi:hypothetical protein